MPAAPGYFKDGEWQLPGEPPAWAPHVELLAVGVLFAVCLDVLCPLVLKLCPQQRLLSPEATLSGHTSCSVFSQCTSLAPLHAVFDVMVFIRVVTGHLPVHPPPCTPAAPLHGGCQRTAFLLGC